MEHQNAKEWAQNTKLAWGVCRATQHFDDGTSKHKEMLLFHCFTACYVFGKEETLAFSAKIPAILSQNSRFTANFRICERTRTRKSRGHQPYPRNRRAIGSFITHCHQQKIFTPLQTHGMEKITAWRGRKISLATQKNKAFTTESAHSNKFLQNKQRYFRFYFVITK